MVGLRVQHDISVAGFDNREISTCAFPKLTTVDIDLKAIGFIAAQMAIEKLSGLGQYAEQQHVIVPGKLVLRDTVAAVRDG